MRAILDNVVLMLWPTINPDGHQMVAEWQMKHATLPDAPIPPLPELVLRRAPQAGDWRLCATGRCAPLGEWLGGEADPVTLFASPDQTCSTTGVPR